MPRRVSASASPRSLHLLCALCVVSLFFLSVGYGRHNTTDPSSEPDHEKRKVLCSEIQKILADDLPYLPLWLTDVVSVHRRSLGELQLSPTGDFDFLTRLHYELAKE